MASATWTACATRLSAAQRHGGAKRRRRQHTGPSFDPKQEAAQAGRKQHEETCAHREQQALRQEFRAIARKEVHDLLDGGIGADPCATLESHRSHRRNQHSEPGSSDPPLRCRLVHRSSLPRRMAPGRPMFTGAAYSRLMPRAIPG